MNQKFLSRMKRSSRMGTYGFVLCAVVLVAVILVNLLVGLLPARVTVFDVSGVGLTEISEETAKFVSKMEEDVTIYWLCGDGIVDDQFELLLTRYEEAGDHITVKVIDTTKEPSFASKYSDAALSEYSVIVESGQRSIAVDRSEMYYYTNYLFPAVVQLYPQYFPSSLISPMTLETLTAACSQYGALISMALAEQGMNVGNDITAYSTVHSFCGEAQLTAALDYVTRDYIPHGYLLTGHGATTPSETLAEMMGSMGLDVETLDLRVAQSVPADANCLILFSPENDLSAHETTLIENYLNEGGSLMLNTSPESVASCPNLQSVCEIFGLTAAAGVVEEGDTGFISGSRFTLVPTVSTAHSATAYISQSNYKARMPMSHAITVADTLPAGVNVTPLFTTSETANRVDVNDTSATLGTPGKHHIAVAATKSISRSDGTTDTAHLTWYGSANAFTDTVATASSVGNYYYYTATLSSMSEPFASPYEGLSAVGLSAEYLSLSDSAALLTGLVVVVVIPVTLLTVGIVIWVRRKKR